MNKTKKEIHRNSRDPTKDSKSFILWFLKGGVISYLFYRSFLCMGILGFIGGIFGVFWERKQEKKCRRKQINLEFREGMQGIAAALNAGYSVENAFAEAAKDLELLYGKRSALASEFRMIVTKCQLNQPVEELLQELALQVEVEDIRRFAEIFQIAKRTGGDLIAITRTAADRISEKIEVQREIEAMSAGKRMEAQVMNCVPLGMILYFWICSPDFLDCLYQGNGRIIMTFFLLVYLLAYYWSERIIQIKI